MISKSVEETGKIARDIVKKLKPQATATVFALSGNLGSGKTTFTKAFAEAIGISSSEITSPTFVILKNYDISFCGFKKFTHIDAYRLEKAEEIVRLGWEALVFDPTNLILVEWPEHISAVLPKDSHTITFSVVDENTREIGL
ncbi:MAG: hypothetical protein RLZZ67_64 [Candidatus Parcubacteria bacterium]|jgi:tRNA threonylcarbamoyladenosine biosynthesis protein TsaE